MALTEATAFRSMHGICTRPPTGSHVRPRWCSMPISAAFSTCSGVPPNTAQSPAAAIEHATPTSPGSPLQHRILRRSPCREFRLPRRSTKVDHPVIARGRYEAREVVQDGRYDSSRTICWRSDDTSSGGVLLIYCKCIQIHPIHDVQGSPASGRAWSFRKSSRPAAHLKSPGSVPSVRHPRSTQAFMTPQILNNPFRVSASGRQ